MDSQQFCEKPQQKHIHKLEDETSLRLKPAVTQNPTKPLTEKEVLGLKDDERSSWVGVSLEMVVIDNDERVRDCTKQGW